MTQQEFSIAHDLYRQIEHTANVEILPAPGDFMVILNGAKEDKAAMRKFKKMLVTHDRSYKKCTLNINSF